MRWAGGSPPAVTTRRAMPGVGGGRRPQRTPQRPSPLRPTHYLFLPPREADCQEPAMTTDVAATVTPPGEALKQVAEAMTSPNHARTDDEVRSLPAGAAANPPNAEPLLSRVAYDCGYYLAYGIVFPPLFVVNIVPGGAALVSGFVDGAAAARDYVHGVRSGPRLA
jgi:hypothetical protein